jgi:hypothetical protein
MSYESRKIEAADGGYVDIVDEVHRVPFGGRFELALPGVDRLSVIVTDRLSGRILQESLDYSLVGDGLALAVQILPGSGIEVGTELLVSYRAAVVPSQTVGGPAFNYMTRVTVRWLSVYQGWRHRTGLLLATGPGSPRDGPNWDETTLGMRVEVPVRIGSASGSMERRWRNFFGDYSVVDNFSGRLLMKVGPRLTAIASAGYQSYARQTRYTSRQGEASVIWQQSDILTVEGGLSYWGWSEAPRSAGFLSPNVRLTLVLGELQARLRYGRYIRDASDGPYSAEDRLLVSLVRRFR